MELLDLVGELGNEGGELFDLLASPFNARPDRIEGLAHQIGGRLERLEEGAANISEVH